MINMQQQQNRHIAREILSHIMIQGHLPNMGITDNSLPIARELERAGILKMDDNGIDFILADKQKAQFLVHGS